jgi:hypothetical protein
LELLYHELLVQGYPVANDLSESLIGEDLSFIVFHHSFYDVIIGSDAAQLGDGLSKLDLAIPEIEVEAL